jgi:hypothetical protein
MYRCGDCGSPVIVLPNLVVRKCACKGPIVAEMTAKMEGRGGLR